MNLFSKQRIETLNDIDAIEQISNSHVSLFFGKKLKISYEHILGIEISQTKKGKLNIGDSHHDYQKFLKKKGPLTFANKIYNEHRCYKTKLYDGNNFIRDKTFFPSHWSRSKVIEKIYEAYNNFLKNGKKPLLDPDGKYTIECSTNEGIEIILHITKNAELKSAYPVFK